MILAAFAPLEWFLHGGPRTVLMMVLLVGTLVLIHEGGHYVVARLCGVSVKVFSLGIGQRLFGIKIGKTDFRISAFPIGGYVRWVGADPFADSGADEDQDWIDAKGSFIHKPAWQRLLIVAAGPVTNLVLPVLVFTGLYLAGDPQPASEVGRVEAGTAASRAGVQVGDRVVSVDGTPVLTWLDIYEALDKHAGDSLAIEVDRDGQRLPLVLTGEAGAAVGDETGVSLVDLGLGDSYPDTAVLIDDSRSPAAHAGVQTGDAIAKVDGTPVRTWNDVERGLLGKSSATLDVVRGKEPLTFTISPDPAWLPTRLAPDDDTWATWGLASGTLGIGRIGALEDGTQTPAQCSELREGDRLLRLGERDVHTYLDVLRAVAATVDGIPAEGGKARPIEFTVRRDGVVSTFNVTPDVVQTVDGSGRYTHRPVVGFGPAGSFVNPLNVPRPYPLLQASSMAVRETWGTARFMVEQLGEMATGGAPMSKNLGGPIEVFSTLGQAAEQGLFVAARRFAQLSLSLGVINLLPIPVLDGGQIVTYGAEWIRGRALPYRLRERLQQVGLLFLMALLLVVTVWDVQRNVGGKDDATAAAPAKCA